MSPLALYVHWPFCKAKCPYCDFNSHVREGVDQAAWKDALLSELRHVAEKIPGRQLTSIFFGGGTPSLMPPATVGAVIDAATKHWQAASDIEITLEANPTSVEAASFKGFRAAGVNRVSLGVQSLRAADLEFLGRKHNVDEAKQAVDLARNTFPRYSFDLIYARPNQTAAQWEEELNEALAFAGDHLSLYQLTIEPNTAFHHAYHERKSFALPEEDGAAELYELTQHMMEARGMPAYEISNHARPGDESRHNLAYWKGYEYAGVGPGAHGRIRNGQWNATQTLKSPELWLSAVQRDGHGYENWESIDARTRLEERVMMGLRLREGLLRADIDESMLNAKALAMAQKENLLEVTPTYLRPTAKGRLLLSSLTASLLS